MYQQQQQNNSTDTARNASKLGMVIVQAWAATVEVFLHRSFGQRYLGVAGAVGIMVVLAFSMVWPGFNLAPLMLFLGVFVVMCARARLESWRECRRGIVQHSYYNGYPRLMRFLPTWNEVSVKRFVEPCLTFFLAMILMPVNPPLGCYLVVAACCLAGTNSTYDQWNRMQALEMNDAVITQRQIAGKFRELQGHWNWN